MASLKERVTTKVKEVRERRPIVDHLVKMVAHYGAVNGNGQAGAVTFFGFLSFFPILALAFFLVGYVSQVYGEANTYLVQAIDEIFPGLIGNGETQISLTDFQENAGAIGIIGLVGVLYSGLGWLSGMREALLTMFKMPARVQPNFVVGKARDVVVLATVGLTMLVSVALSSLVTGLSETILEFVGIYDIFGVPTLVNTLGLLLAIAASTVLLLALFKLLAKPPVPDKALLHGAILGALAFEVLKLLATLLIASTKSQPAFQAFGVALILVVWINYFSRVVMFGASWAYTSPIAEASRAAEFVHMPGAALAAGPDALAPSSDSEPDEASTPAPNRAPLVEPVSPALEPAPPAHRAGAGSNKTRVAGGALAGLTAVGAVAALRKRRSR